MQVPMGNTIPPGTQASPGHERGDIPNAAGERNIGGATRHSRIYSNMFLVPDESGGLRHVIDLKQLNAYQNALQFHNKLSSENCKNADYEFKIGCVISRHNPSQDGGLQTKHCQIGTGASSGHSVYMHSPTSGYGQRSSYNLSSQSLLLHLIEPQVSSHWVFCT